MFAENFAVISYQAAKDSLGLKNKSSSDWTPIYFVLLLAFLLYIFFFWLERFSAQRRFERLKREREFEKKMRLADLRQEKKRREFEESFINLFKRLLKEAEQARKARVVSAKDKEELKYLFRTMALKYHPDKSRNESERKLFEFLMKKINEAHDRGDLFTLKHIDSLYEEHKNEIL